MSVFSHWPRMGVAVGAAVLALIIASTAPAIAVVASVTLSPAVGPPTTDTAVSGEGFAPLEGVSIFFDSTQVATAGTGLTGSFTAALTVPASATPGNHTVLARGRISGLRAQAVFMVRTDWSQFRFDAARRGHNPYENVLGPANASRLTKAWSTPTRGAVRSSPVYVGGKVAVGSDDGALYILDPRSGRRLVAFQTGGAISGSPAGFQDPDLFVFGSADGNLYAVKPNGRLAWKAALGSPVTSSPLVINAKAPGKVVVGTEAGRVFAFTKQGTPLWSAQLDGAISGSPAGFQDPNLMGDPTQTVVVGTRAGSLYVLSGSTGAVQWRTALDGPIASTPAISASEDFGDPAGFEDPELFVGTTVGTLHKLSAGGSLRWSLPLDGPISSSVALGNPDTMPGIFVATEAGTIARIADGPEPARVWSASLGAAVKSSPALANGVLYVGSAAAGASNFFALDAASGAILLAAVLPGGVQSSPAVADGRVFVGTLGGDIFGFDAGV